MTMSAGKLWGLRRLADDNGRFKMTAVDQRPPIKQLISDARGLEPASDDDVRAVKRLLVEELAKDSSALLLDPHHAYPAAIDVVPPAKGLLITLEDSIFDETPDGRRSSTITNWSVEKIKRSGADAVKLLAWHRPDAATSVIDHQRALVAQVGDACQRFDIPFVFELLTYALADDTTELAHDAARRAEHVIRSVEDFSAVRFGVDLFKLESPLPPSQVPDPDDPEAGPVAQAIFDELGRAAARPWVMLSAGADRSDFQRILTFAYRAGASGFLAGRAIWRAPLQHFPDMDASRGALRTDGAAYLRSIGNLTDTGAVPFFEHPAYGNDGPLLQGDLKDFRRTYGDFGGGS
ncbi:MAG: tagatose 1,6-diphosphate aldolase [Actinomycetota bacterium]|nr:tagatose 1,6-diphosphate aldolase [Actinomycetota bacterium]